MSNSSKIPAHLGDGRLLTEDADEGLGHILPFRTYLITFAALIALTIVTVGSSFFDFGNYSLTIAVLIASLKAALVMAIFMHLRFEAKLILLYAVYPIVVLGLLIGGSISDDISRENLRPLNSPE